MPSPAGQYLYVVGWEHGDQARTNLVRRLGAATLDDRAERLFPTHERPILVLQPAAWP